MRFPKILLSLCQQRAARITRREPSKTIGENYLRRWHVVPKNPLFNMYLHHVTGDDPDTNLHDHPWLFNYSLVLRGKIREEMPKNTRTLVEGTLTFRGGAAPHRLMLESPDSLTLFITGPKIRRWGFHTPKGWVNSKGYLQRDGNGRSTNSEYS